MRYNADAAVVEWSIYEPAIERGSKVEYPFSEALGDSTTAELLQVFKQLRLLRVAGCPPDRSVAESPDLVKLKPPCQAGGSEHDLYLLKAKPSPYRLYFRILSGPDRQIQMLYAIKKKTDHYSKDKSEQKRACTILGRVLSRSATSVEISIPAA